MKSRWSHLRQEAETMRKAGGSIRDIEKTLNIPRSTLSGWFRSIILTSQQLQELRLHSEAGLAHARTLASAWHRARKQERLTEIERKATATLDTIAADDIRSRELALAFLYLGEGAKSSQTSLGSSDPRIARFFVTSLIDIYEVPVEKIRCFLHLRADQDDAQMKRYWSRTLGLPVENFGKSSIDLRTAGKTTYPTYYGVCSISCGKVEIQRRLMYIAHGFCDRLVGADTEHTGG